MNRGRFEPLPGPFSAARRTPMRSGTLPDAARRIAAAILRTPNLRKRLPLSPEQVFRYVQADAARFAGFDLTAAAAAGPWIDLRGGWSRVRAEDLLFDEPLFGVPPFEQRSPPTTSMLWLSRVSSPETNCCSTRI